MKKYIQLAVLIVLGFIAGYFLTGCTLNSPFLQPSQPQQQPIIINQMPAQQLPYIQPQLIQRTPDGRSILVTQQAPAMQQGAPLTEDEEIDRERVRVLMEMATQMRSTPFNSMTIAMARKAHDIDIEIGVIHAKYAESDRSPAFLYENEQPVNDDELGQVRFLSQDEADYLKLAGQQ